MTPARRTSANTLLLVTTMLWGANLPMLKWLSGYFDPELMSGLRILAACVPLLWMLLRGASRPRLDRAQLYRLLLCGVLMVYLNQLLLIGGLSRSSATNGALITALSPLAAALLATWILRERLMPRRLLGVLIGLGGVALVILQRPGAELSHGGLGDLMVVGAVIVFTLGALLLQRMAAEVDALVISVSIHIVGAACLLLHAGALTLLQGSTPKVPDAVGAWTMMLLSGALCTGIGNLLWNRAIPRIGVTRASLWLYWVPIFGIAAAVLFLDEPLSLWHLVGLALVLGGTYFGSRHASVQH